MSDPPSSSGPVSLMFSGMISRYLNIFYSTWGLLLAGLVFALPMMHMRIKDITTDEFDDGASTFRRHSDVWDE